MYLRVLNRKEREALCKVRNVQGAYELFNLPLPILPQRRAKSPAMTFKIAT
jgi:hypothetical protein